MLIDYSVIHKTITTDSTPVVVHETLTTDVTFTKTSIHPVVTSIFTPEHVLSIPPVLSPPAPIPTVVSPPEPVHSFVKPEVTVVKIPPTTIIKVETKPAFTQVTVISHSQKSGPDESSQPSVRVPVLPSVTLAPYPITHTPSPAGSGPLDLE